jgi:hypothetical protein
MNLRIRELAALMLVMLLGPIMVHAQLLNPSYLSEMPAPARIIAEIKGKDVEDTGQRQMGAFMVLIKMMDDMAWGLEHRRVSFADTRKCTPDELRIRLGYQTVYADLWHKVTNKEGHVYDRDRDLLNEMLQKFFSESFRAKYFQADLYGESEYKAYRERMYGSTKGNQPNQPSSTSPRTSQPNQPSTPGATSGRTPGTATDPSIAKSRAANVDTKVLGLALGEPLRLPSCDSLSDFSTRTCVLPNPAAGLAALGLDLGPRTVEERRTDVTSLLFPRDNCPSWLSDCSASVMTYDGLLVAIDMKTKGHTVNQAVVRDLREKYGPPTSVKPIEVTPRVGNPFKASNLEWLLPGLHVVYEVVTKGENEGEVTDVESGQIGFETEAAYHRRLAKEKAKPKVKL